VDAFRDVRKLRCLRVFRVLAEFRDIERVVVSKDPFEYRDVYSYYTISLFDSRFALESRNGYLLKIVLCS
jgi:hypothetical protein